MLVLELSSYVLEIPNDGYASLSHISLAVQHSVKCNASRLVNIGKKLEGNFEHKHALLSLTESNK